MPPGRCSGGVLFLDMRGWLEGGDGLDTGDKKIPRSERLDPGPWKVT